MLSGDRRDLGAGRENGCPPMTESPTVSDETVTTTPERPDAKLLDEVGFQLLVSGVLLCGGILDAIRADEPYQWMTAVIVWLLAIVVAVRAAARRREIVAAQRVWERDRLAEREAELSPAAPEAPPRT